MRIVTDAGIVFSGVGSAEIEPSMELPSPAVSLIRNAVGARKCARPLSGRKRLKHETVR